MADVQQKASSGTPFLSRALIQLSVLSPSEVRGFDDDKIQNWPAEELAKRKMEDKAIAETLSAVWHIPLHPNPPLAADLAKQDDLWRVLNFEKASALLAVPLVVEDGGLVVGMCDPNITRCFSIGEIFQKAQQNIHGDVVLKEIRIVSRSLVQETLALRKMAAKAPSDDIEQEKSWSFPDEKQELSIDIASWHNLDDDDGSRPDGTLTNAWRAIESGTNLASFETDQLISRFTGRFDVSMLQEKRQAEFDIDVDIDIDLDVDSFAVNPNAESAQSEAKKSSQLEKPIAPDSSAKTDLFLEPPIASDDVLIEGSSEEAPTEVLKNPLAPREKPRDDLPASDEGVFSKPHERAPHPEGALPPPKIFEKEAPTRLDAFPSIGAVDVEQQPYADLQIKNEEENPEVANAGQGLDGHSVSEKELEEVANVKSVNATLVGDEPSALSLLSDEDLFADSEEGLAEQNTESPPAQKDIAEVLLALDDDDATASVSIPFGAAQLDALGAFKEEFPISAAPVSAPAFSQSLVPDDENATRLETATRDPWLVPPTQNSATASIEASSGDDALSEVARMAMTDDVVDGMQEHPLNAKDIQPPVSVRTAADKKELSDLERAEAAAAEFVAQWHEQVPNTGSEKKDAFSTPGEALIPAGGVFSDPLLRDHNGEKIDPADSQKSGPFLRSSPDFPPLSIADDNEEEQTSPELIDDFDLIKGRLPTAFRLEIANTPSASSSENKSVFGHAVDGNNDDDVVDDLSNPAYDASGFEESAFTNTAPLEEVLEGGTLQLNGATKSLRAPTLLDDSLRLAVKEEHASEKELDASLAAYELHERLGSGGMAEVVRATRKSDGKEVALKMLHSHLANEPDSRARFAREGELWSKVKHPNVVELLDTAAAAKRPHLACAVVSDGTVEQLLKKFGRVPPLVAAVIVADLLRGLSAVHAKGILHRDIKPENLLISSTGSVLLADFGVACRIGDQNRAGMDGTALYMSPEQVRAQPLDDRSDLYSAGVVLYELLSGKNPFVSDNPSATLLRVTEGDVLALFETDATVPAILEHVVEKLMHRDVEKRYSTASEALQDLLAFLLPLQDETSGLLSRAVKTPKGTAGHLMKLQLAAELERAQKLSSGTKSQRAQSALAYRRCFLLDSSVEQVRAALRAAKEKDGFDFDAKGSNRLVAMRQALRDHPKDEALLRRVADAYRSQGDLVRGATYQKRLLRLCPDDDAALSRLQWMVGDHTDCPFGTGFSSAWYEA